MPLASCIFVLVFFKPVRPLDTNVVEIKNQVVRSPPDQCYDGLGCFVNDEDFYDIIYRPISLLPIDRKTINTTFLLYTRSNLDHPNNLRADDHDTIANSDFDPDLDTKWIVHGFLTATLDKWMLDMKDAFLKVDSFNVIIVDWSGGNGAPYTQSVANTRLVGAEIAYLMEVMIQFGLEPQKQHILGHSLGAHIAGYAGSRTPNLGRITAMDPAEFLFGGLKPVARLDSTDAQFVDVIHTSAKSLLLLGFGMINPVGHVDFYPNGGADQPGCTVTEFPEADPLHGSEGLSGLFSCNHHRSIDLVIDYIATQQCSMVGFVCEDFETFSSGACYDCGAINEKCAIMGQATIDYQSRFQRDRNGTVVPVKMYLKTFAKPPYCLFQYQVTMKLNNEGVTNSGQLVLILNGIFASSEEIPLGKGSIQLVPGESSKFLVTTGQKLGTIITLTFKWVKAYHLFSKSTNETLGLEWIRVAPMITDNRHAQEFQTKYFCQNVEQTITTGNEVTLNRWARCNSKSFR